ncbi:hypothetical protein MKW94_022994, partial [Papaver nudicaule]|nr:hypothetical protein [Papaver nudicaule]
SSCNLRMFISSCKQLRSPDHGAGVSVEQEVVGVAEPVVEEETCLPSDSSLRQVYLLHVTIVNLENKKSSQLEILREDIQMVCIPFILSFALAYFLLLFGQHCFWYVDAAKTLTSINLWMNNAKSRSSTHYDPDHNLLCVVAGCKQGTELFLWPPSALSSLYNLYPMPVYSKASNHRKLDLLTHSRAQSSVMYSLRVTLQAGDALFVSKGWLHQVDSDDVTITVNFWW